MGVCESVDLEYDRVTVYSIIHVYGESTHLPEAVMYDDLYM